MVHLNHYIHGHLIVNVVVGRWLLLMPWSIMIMLLGNSAAGYVAIAMPCLEWPRIQSCG